MIFAAVALSASLPSQAYDVGGHHYTLSAIFYSDDHQHHAHARPQRLIEAFCAQLPDLSMELDAITQREHVVFNPREMLWGAMGRCTTPSCTHMVASQFYLHALTGTDAGPVRSAAIDIIRDIDARIAGVNAGAPKDMHQRLANLWCERGFAAHLFGDTYAHATLKNPDTLYPTGLGHTRDMHEPDYMLARDARSMPDATRWSAWVRRAAAVLGHGNDGDEVARIAAAVDYRDGEDDGEKALQARLADFISPAWKPYAPAVSEWNRPLVPSRRWWIFGRIEDNLAQVILENTCRMQLARFAGQVGLPAIAGSIPQCDVVWSDYRDVAMEHFAGRGVHPGCCDERALRQDRLEDGCRQGKCPNTAGDDRR